MTHEWFLSEPVQAVLDEWPQNLPCPSSCPLLPYGSFLVAEFMQVGGQKSCCTSLFPLQYEDSTSKTVYWGSEG